MRFYKDTFGDESESIRQLVDWDIVLSESRLDRGLNKLKGNERWSTALPILLTDFTELLRDTLDLMKELGGAGERSDLSYSIRPSISEHCHNHSFRDWTILVDLNRDAWLAMAKESHERARLAANAWLRIPYPLFRRLAFYAAAQNDIVPRSEGLEWLLTDGHWWLWSIETQRETMRLLVALAPRLDKDELVRLESAVLAGPPRTMFRTGIEENVWSRIRDQKICLRLAKIKQSEAKLSTEANQQLIILSLKYPWKLSANKREEFPAWMSDHSELNIHRKTPRKIDKLVEWLQENPRTDGWPPDDWRDRCRDDFDDAASALISLANKGIWPTDRWEEALGRWSNDELTKRSWDKIASVLDNAPKEILLKLSHAVSRWLEKLARTFEGQEVMFFKLCDLILELDYDRVLISDHDVEEGKDDPIGCAIIHPVGNVTEALLHWWYRKSIEKSQGLTKELHHRFTRLCDTEESRFRHGRVVLAVHIIPLFQADREWVIQFLLPLFQWENSEVEAQSAWEGFLWSPRLYRPLLEELKPAFLDTANHYSQLVRHDKQYASLLTFAGLDPGDLFNYSELALVMRELPQGALDHAAGTFYSAVDSAGGRRGDYWRNRAAPFLRHIWPKTSNLISKTVSENFGLACIAAGDAFPDALMQISPWLRGLQYPDRIADALHKAGIDTRFPEAALELLYRFVDDEKMNFSILSKCLNSILAEQPELELNHIYLRLKSIVSGD